MSVMPFQSLSSRDFDLLLTIARKGIDDYLDNADYSPPDEERYPGSAIHQQCGCFVTLKVDNALQGCLGAIHSSRSLIAEVYDKGYASSHRDTRFSPLTEAQLPALTVEVSVLTPPEHLAVGSEDALLTYLQDNRVGVILSDGRRQALFLPQVWDQLPEPVSFIHHLKMKAGWDRQYWSHSMSVKTFNVVNHEQKYTQIS